MMGGGANRVRSSWRSAAMVAKAEYRGEQSVVVSRASAGTESGRCAQTG